MLAVRIDRDPNDQLVVRLTNEQPEPRAASGDVLINVQVAGVCSTDLELARGYMGFTGIPGHEFVGVIAKGPRAGQRVVAEINVPPPGFTGDLTARKHAANRTVLGILGRDGAFAQRVTIPSDCCLAVPDDLTNDQAVFAEPVAAALQILDDCDLTKVKRAGVIGAGRLGLLCAQVLNNAKPGTELIVRNQTRAARGTTLGLTPRTAEEIGDARAFDLLVDCTGSPDGLAWCLAHIRPRGQIVLKSTYATPGALDLAPIVIDEVRVLGSRCGPMDAALAALTRGDVQTKPLIEARYPLAQAERALAHAAEPGVLKVLIDVEPPSAD